MTHLDRCCSGARHCESGSRPVAQPLMAAALVSICPSGFKLKHFLRDNETLSSFLRRNASFPEDAIQQIREADIDLGKVRL